MAWRELLTIVRPDTTSTRSACPPFIASTSEVVDQVILIDLKAFTKVALVPGETRTVRLAVPAATLAYYDEKNGWIVEPGEYDVIVGRHSLDHTTGCVLYVVREENVCERQHQA